MMISSVSKVVCGSGCDNVLLLYDEVFYGVGHYVWGCGCYAFSGCGGIHLAAQKAMTYMLDWCHLRFSTYSSLGWHTLRGWNFMGRI